MATATRPTTWSSTSFRCTASIGRPAGCAGGWTRNRPGAGGGRRQARHTKATHCNSTPVTDGRYVVACFGAQGLFAFSMDGEPRWSKELGALDVGPHNDLDLQWGFASSPIIANGLVVLQCDVKRNPFLAAFDLEDGRKVWRVARDDVPGWSTPTALRTDDGWQIITNGCKHMGAVALADGKEVWRMSGGGGIPVPTPVVVDDLIYLTSNHRPLREGDPRRPIFAVRTAARGVLPVPQEGASGRFVAWMTSGRGNYMQTPLVYRGVAYFCNDNGALTAYDAVSGEELYRERLGEGTSGFTASGVAGDGKVYFTSEEGDIHVLRAGRSFEVLAVNAMSEICMSTPAISRGALLFRTRGHVACVGQRN